jgi:hypothetical protein
MPHAVGIKPSRELLAHLEEKWQRRAEEFALVIFQCLPETDPGMNVFGKLDERDGQFVERIVVELARRVDERFLRSPTTPRKARARPASRWSSRPAFTGGRLGSILAARLYFRPISRINSCSSFLGKGFADLISLHGTRAFYPVKVS